MALIKCRECGQQISSQAKQCPNCGNPRSNPTNFPALKLAVGLALLVALLFIGPIVKGLSTIVGPVIQDHTQNFLDKGKRSTK